MAFSPFGADRVEQAPDGAYLLSCPVSKGWTARRAKTLTSSEYPGTAVRWDGALFEVVALEPDAAGTVRYRLAPWEDRHTARAVATYDAANEQAREAEQHRRREAISKRRWSLLLAPLAGHLPASVQKRMESEIGSPARLLTIASALPLLVLGMLGLLAFLIDSFGGGSAVLSGWPIFPLPIAAFLVLESGVRLGVAFAQAEPMGSLEGWLVYSAWRETCRILGGRSGRYASGSSLEPPPAKENR